MFFVFFVLNCRKFYCQQKKEHMIREDRVQLNERFCQVFKLLEERGEVVKNDRGGKGMGDFAEKLLGNRTYGHIVRAFLNPDDKRCINYSQARILCSEFGVNESYMFDGVGTPFGFDLPKSSQSSDPDVRKGNILYTTVEAFAGPTVSNSFVKESNRFFSIPGLDGDGLVAFPIVGNSMDPLILDGDIVVCRAISSISEVRDNKVYAVKYNGEIWVKFVQKIMDTKNRVARLKLISANHLEHDPWEVDVNEHLRIYQVIRKITDLQ